MMPACVVPAHTNAREERSVVVYMSEIKKLVSFTGTRPLTVSILHIYILRNLLQFENPYDHRVYT